MISAGYYTVVLSAHGTINLPCFTQGALSKEECRAVIQASEEIGFEPKFSGERYNVRVSLVDNRSL